ncbi:MAG: hypothetical protein HRT72_01135 [Flavobacteriales bacterium]|nr:hypothetical protein [Flavobacteriales bacterium]
MSNKELIQELYVASNKMGELCSEIIVKDLNIDANVLAEIKARMDMIIQKSDELQPKVEIVTDSIIENILDVIAETDQKEINEEAGEALEEVVESKEEPTQDVVKEALSEIISEVEKEVSSNGKSLHEKIQGDNSSNSVVDKLQSKSILSIAKSIDLNDSFVFISELFSGDKEKYNNSIEHLDSLAEKREAIDYVNTYLATEHNWDSEAESTIKFKGLIDRRYV